MKLHQNDQQSKMNPLISIVIPVYNEENCLGDCLLSLKKQSYKKQEIIIVDDGSTDNSKEIAKKFEVKVLVQNHKGPGTARNLGATNANGEILVFVDADMTFEKDFIKDLTKMIISKNAIGTFSKNEFLANPKNTWAKCWSINRNWPEDRLIPINSPDSSPVFRAILKNEFEKIQGFDTTGEYTDDWSLSLKLGKKAIAAKGAIYFHSNPASLGEVIHQAKWFSTNMFLSGSFIRKVKSAIFYSLPFSITIGLYKSITKKTWQFVFFKLVFDFFVWISILKLFIP